MPSKSIGDQHRSGGPVTGKTYNLCIVSDAAGGLGRHMLNCVLTQFEDLKRNIHCFTFCDSEEKLRNSLCGVQKQRCLVFSTLASLSLKAMVDQICNEHGVPHCDLTGGCAQFIEQWTGLKASNDVNAVHEQDAAYFGRIEALEFSLQHDDSRRLESIHEAEIVLVGVSRVSKTPTAAYLGWLGYKVANVSLVPEMGVPEEILRCRDKCVALTIRAKALAEIRTRRFKLNRLNDTSLGSGEETGYCDLRLIIREIMDAEREFRELSLPMIDTTDLTIEETAAKVLEALGK